MEQNLNCETEVQLENACLSLAVLQFLNIPVKGWDRFYWPCRMERFMHNNRSIVLDGCHNGDSLERFLKGLRTAYPRKKLFVLFGAGHEKSIKDMIQVLFNNADCVLMVRSKHFRAMSEQDLLAAAPVDKLYLIHELQRGRLAALFTDESGAASNRIDQDGQGDAALGDRLHWAIHHSNPDE